METAASGPRRFGVPSFVQVSLIDLAFMIMCRSASESFAGSNGSGGAATDSATMCCRSTGGSAVGKRGSSTSDEDLRGDTSAESSEPSLFRE